MNRPDLDRPTTSVEPSTRTLVITTTSRDETVELGRLIGSLLPAGTIVLLDGDLGAGKTVLTSGLAEGMGCLGPVSSPTFTLLMEHPPGPKGIALYHFDVYRLESVDEFFNLGFDEYLSGDGVCVIEWSSRIRSSLPADCLEIELSMTIPDRPDERVIHLKWPGHEHLLHRLSHEGKETQPC